MSHLTRLQTLRCQICFLISVAQDLLVWWKRVRISSSSSDFSGSKLIFSQNSVRNFEFIKFPSIVCSTHFSKLLQAEEVSVTVDIVCDNKVLQTSDLDKTEEFLATQEVNITNINLGEYVTSISTDSYVAGISDGSKCQVSSLLVHQSVSILLSEMLSVVEDAKDMQSDPCGFSCPSNYFCDPSEEVGFNCFPICYADVSEDTCCYENSRGNDIKCVAANEQCYIATDARNAGDFVCR